MEVPVSTQAAVVRVLPVTQIMAELGVGKFIARRVAREIGRKVGRKYLVDREVFEAWLKSRNSESAAAVSP